MPVTEAREAWGREGGDNQGGQLALTTASEDPEEPSDASGKPGLFMG